MTTAAAAAPASAPSALALVATRALGVLDDFRVPYGKVAAAGDAWHSLSAGDAERALYWPGEATGGAATACVLGALPIRGRVLAEPDVARFAARLPGAWGPAEPLLRDGRPHSSVWRSEKGGTILPFDPDEVIDGYRSERYLQHGAGAGLSLKAAARRLYYGVRPLLPRRFQISLRRAFSRVQERAEFPRWPAEPALHDLAERVLGWAADTAGSPLPYLAAWPDGRDWALVLTHDVETARGRDAIDRVRTVESAAGLRSSWNLVPERYTVSDGLVEQLWRAGCEVGVHGLRHDGRDLESLRTLRRRLPEIRRWADRWGAVGFRAPATHRVWEWMPMLGFDYDSSSPDSDPYEPMSGGCCSWLPFFNGDLVELPITLPQDHTVFVILRRDESLWQEKAELLRRRGGMALLITHPDYLLDDETLGAYRRFLASFQDDPTAWTPLPREVSAWWRRRAASSPVPTTAGWSIEGPAAGEAVLAFAQPSELVGWPVVAAAAGE